MAVSKSSATVPRVILLLLCLVYSVLSIEAGKLGIVLNDQLALEPKDNPRYKYGWTSIVEFDKNVVDLFSEEEIVGLTRQAFNDMGADFDEKAKMKPNPYKNFAKANAMAAIVFGKQIYFASSVRGGGIAYSPASHPKVKEALLQCQVETAGNTIHRAYAGCAEPLAAHIWYTGSDGKSLNGGLVVTWGKKGKVFALLPPCAMQDDDGPIKDYWGCADFIKTMGLKAIDESTAAKDKDVSPDPKLVPVCI